MSVRGSSIVNVQSDANYTDADLACNILHSSFEQILCQVFLDRSVRPALTSASEERKEKAPSEEVTGLTGAASQPRLRRLIIDRRIMSSGRYLNPCFRRRSSQNWSASRGCRHSSSIVHIP